MILLGDNCYIKLTGQEDVLWDEMFEKMYDPKALDFPFYAALGNHDYSNGAVSFELNYSKAHPESRWKMPAKYYRVELPADKPLVTLLVLDSCKDQMKPQEWTAENAWIKLELAKPRKTRWLVCAAHHPLFSNGDHGDNGVLQRVWGEMFKKYGVDFYLCGHDHDVQHLEIPGWPVSFVLAGGGGARIRPMLVDRRGPFSKSTFGFADLQFTPDCAKCRLVSGSGKVIHEFSRTPDNKVTVTFTTPSDVAIARTPKSIARPDLPSSASSRPAAVN